MRKVFAIFALLVLLGGLSTAWGLDCGVYVTDYLAPQTVKIKPLGGEPSTVARMFAAPGEYESVSFAVRPDESVAEMFINAGPLVGARGTIPAERVRVRSVEGFHGGELDILMDLGGPWNMPALRRELFWVTVHVPEDAAPGKYKGRITVTSKGKPIGGLDVELEVLPIELEEPPFALGFNYSNPHDAQVMAVHLRDMREHGMTTVAPLSGFHLPIFDEDTSELGEFIEAYKAAGFTKPIYFVTPATLCSALAGFGPVDSAMFQRAYLRTMRLLQAEVEKHGVPVIFSIADELTNKALPGIRFGEKLAKLCFEELPDICTASDMNGYLEVVTMAPYLNIAAFNNGWDGIDGHNKGRRLVNRQFLTQELPKTGAIPWFVNTGRGRFPFGFFFWKMTKYGVRGKVEWYYNLQNNARGSVVRTRGTTVWPTLTYERSREGVDDLKYMCKLESLIARAKDTGKARAEARRAEDLVQRIAAAIIDNWTAYTQGGEEFPPEGLDLGVRFDTTGLTPYNIVRRAVAEEIVALEKALG